jgi:hypothetical protein
LEISGQGQRKGRNVYIKVSMNNGLTTATAVGYIWILEGANKASKPKALFFYLFFAISLAALINGASVRSGSESLKNGC